MIYTYENHVFIDNKRGKRLTKCSSKKLSREKKNYKKQK